MKAANFRVAVIVSSLVVGGIALGAAMAPLFAPIPKASVREPLQLSGRSRPSSEDPTAWVEPRSDDTVVAYTPTDAYGGEIWRYPAPAYEAWEPELLEIQDALQDLDAALTREAVEEALRASKETAAQQAETMPAVLRPEVIDEAMRAATEAAAAPSPRPAEAVRKSDLANGLY